MSAQIIDFVKARDARRPYRVYTSANLRSMLALARQLGDAPLAYELAKELLFREGKLGAA